MRMDVPLELPPGRGERRSMCRWRSRRGNERARRGNERVDESPTYAAGQAAPPDCGDLRRAGTAAGATQGSLVIGDVWFSRSPRRMASFEASRRRRISPTVLQVVVVRLLPVVRSRLHT